METARWATAAAAAGGDDVMSAGDARKHKREKVFAGTRDARTQRLRLPQRKTPIQFSN